jgi:hypothetical protein
MKTTLALAAACALVMPMAAAAQTYAHGGYHAGPRPALGAASPRAAAGATAAPRGFGRPSGGVVVGGGPGDRGATRRFDRRYDGGGAAFGLGVVTGGALAGGYYSYGGYPAYAGDYAYGLDAGYDASDAYMADSYADGGYTWSSTTSYADSGYAYPAGEAYAQPGGYPAASAYGDGAGYGQGGYAPAPPAAARACGQWTWDAPLGRYVWAC